jgi:nucleotide-binding universal stress UspA family protein
MTHPSRYQKIVVPLDGSGWGQRAVTHAVDIARSNDSEIILLHVFKPPAREFTPELALAHQGEQIQELREQMKQYLVGVRAELRDEGIRVRTQYIEAEGADVAHLICDFVNEEGVDLIVMSTHGRTGLGRLLFGSVARDVMECVNVPVLLVKPEKE